MYDMTITQATADHVEPIARWFDACRCSCEQAGDLDSARKFIAERLARGQSVVFLASLEGTPAGFVQLYPTFSSVSMCRVWTLNDLYVADTFRRQGVASALWECSRGFAQAQATGRLELVTAKDNLTAQRLYQRLGWQRITRYFVTS